MWIVEESLIRIQMLRYKLKTFCIRSKIVQKSEQYNGNVSRRKVWWISEIPRKMILRFCEISRKILCKRKYFAEYTRVVLRWWIFHIFNIAKTMQYPVHLSIFYRIVITMQPGSVTYYIRKIIWSRVPFRKQLRR